MGVKCGAEEFANSAHLNEFATIRRKERHFGLSGHSLGQIRLASAGWADQQHSLRCPGADFLISVVALQHLKHRHDLFLNLIDALHNQNTITRPYNIIY
jgi:hypothetical protein